MNSSIFLVTRSVSEGLQDADISSLTLRVTMGLEAASYQINLLTYRVP